MRRIWVCTLGLLFLSACHLPEEKLDSGARETLGTLQTASDQNYAIAKEAAKNELPQEVKKVLSPDLAFTPGKNTPFSEKRFDIYADQIPAKAFFLGLVEDTPYNIAVNPNVEGKISLQLKKVTIPEVLETVRNTYGFDFRKTRQGIEILPATIQTRAFQVNYLDVKRDGTSNTQVAAGTLYSAYNSGTSGTSGAAPVAASGAYPGAGGGSNNTGGNSTDINSSTMTTTYKSNFWEELKKAVEAIVGPGEDRKVAVSPIASLLVVSAMPYELKKVEDFLRDANLSLNRQVILEAKVLEVELNDSYQAGVNWSEISGRLGFNQFGGEVVKQQLIPNNNFPVLSEDLVGAPVAFPTGGNAPNLSHSDVFGGVFAITLSAKNLSTFIELLGAQGKVHVLSNPRVSTLNNQKALIKVGYDRFFITNVSTTSTISTSTTQQTPNVTFSPFFSGVALDVTPNITEKDEITLHIHPTISLVEDDFKNFVLNGQEQSYPLAKSIVRESDSIVKARNRETVIIGGLMQDSVSVLREGVPWLKDLPILGNLFRHTVEQTKKSELVILLKPTVIENDTWSEKVDKTAERFKDIEQENYRDANKYRCKDADC